MKRLKNSIPVQRIDNVLDELGGLWKEHPDLRLGQLILNAVHKEYTGNPVDVIELLLYNIEDYKLLELLNRLYDEKSSNSN